MGNARLQEERVRWFDEHFADGPAQIVDFFSGDGISLEGTRVADIGSGDGIIDLGLMTRARPAYLAGFDVKRTDEAELLRMARAARAVEDLPQHLEFFACQDRCIPAEDASFDYVVSWSTFEHLVDPPAVAAEIHRILRPTGGLFLQLYPFYLSGPGSHLWTWFPEGFAQLRYDTNEISARIAAEPERSSPEWARDRLEDFRSLNRLTLDGLQVALGDAGLVISKVELITNAFHIPRELLEFRIADLGITGIKLLAYRP